MILSTLFNRAPERGAGFMPDPLGVNVPAAAALQPASPVRQQAQQGGIGGFLGNLRDRLMAPNAYGPDLGAKLTRFGAELQDINDGGNRAAAIHQRMEAQRKQQAEEARRKQMNDAIRSSYREDGTFDRQAFARSAIEGGLVNDLGEVTALMGDGRKLIETDEGLFSYDPETNTGEYIETFEPDPRPAPMGMVRNPETGRLEWEPGYVEAQGQLAGTRREAVISRPAQSRARSGGSRRSRPAAPSRAPWEY